MERESFVINIMDPTDVSAKLADARRILKDKEDQLAAVRDLEREVQQWLGTVEFLETRAPAEPLRAAPITEHVGNGNGDGQPKVHELVVDVVNRANRKIRAKDVHNILVQEGHAYLTPSSVSNALHYAAHRAKPPVIKDALGRGMYAPLSFQELPDPGRPHEDMAPTGPTQAQATDVRAAPWREDWSGARHPATPSTG
jgi:hypothetical protein